MAPCATQRVAWATRAGAGFLAGFTLNPYLAGALIGGATTAGNIAMGIDESDNVCKDIAIGAAFGLVVGGIGGQLGENIGAANKVPEIGRAIGEVLGADATNIVSAAQSAFSE